MKKNKKILLTILITFALPVTLYKVADISYKQNHIKLKTNNKILPQLFPITEDLILSIDSPDNKYKLNLYLNSGNASVDFSIRGELENQFGMKKNIYYKYHEKIGEAEFIDNDTVIINDETLDIHTDSFKEI